MITCKSCINLLNIIWLITLQNARSQMMRLSDAFSKWNIVHKVFLALAMYASGRDEMTVQEEAFNAQPYLVMKNVEQQMKELADKDKERDGDVNE